LQPQPSLGSLPQLAADLLIHTLDFKLVGYLALRDTIPAVSGLDGVEGQDVGEGISFGVEGTFSLKEAVTIVLPRAPVIRARKLHHLQSMKLWIEAAGVKEVLLLAGVDAASRVDEGLRAVTPLRHFTFSSTSGLIERLSALTPSFVASSSTSTSTTKIPPIPHGGLTRSLLETLSPNNTSALLIYAAEGDNSASAFLLADALAAVDEAREVSQLGRGEWRKPKSWERGLMGEE
ncbi:hypothetical protein BCR35DRAFT_252774, partial [Leucosporidium creatinivorum]